MAAQAGAQNSLGSPLFRRVLPPSINVLTHIRTDHQGSVCEFFNSVFVPLQTRRFFYSSPDCFFAEYLVHFDIN